MRLIAHNDGRELRGSERQLVHIARGLRERGHDVLVSCRAGAPLEAELARAGVETTGRRPRGALALPSVWVFRGLISRSRPDAVLLTSWKRLATGAWAARSAGVPRVVARLGIVRAMPPGGVSAGRLRRALECSVDVLVVNSDAVAHAWLDSAPWFAADRLRVIRNGVEGARGHPGALRRELELPAGARLIACVAGLEKRKGIDLLLRALTELPHDVHAAIAGEGTERGALGALAAQLGVASRVHWLGMRSDVPDLLAAADAFVLPTRQDSIPNALLEAMALGVPVVTTAGNGAEEALGPRDGRASAGWIVRAEDPHALAVAANEALAGAAAERKEAFWRAAHWFGIPRMVSEYEAVLFGRA